jgi:alpha-D-xyloside xylohydrolase
LASPLALALLLGGPLLACQSAPPMNQAPADPPTGLVSGDYAVQVVPADLTLRLTRKDDVLLGFPADAIQLGSVDKLDDGLSYDPYWMEYGEDLFPPTPPASLMWHTVTAVHVAEHSSDQLLLTLDFSGGLHATLTITRDAAGRFGALLVPDAGASGRAVALLRLRPRVDPSEGFYGMGEWPDAVNHRGKVRPMQMEADVTESADNENHVPVPLLIGTRGWGMFVQSQRVGAFAVANKQPDLVEITYGTAEQSNLGLRFHLFAADQPIDIVRRYYDVTGDPLLPAPWALGPWIWRNEDRDQAQVLDDIAKIRQLDLATSAIWIDRPYATKVESFDWDSSRFPMPDQMFTAAHNAGLRMALWQAPYLEPGAPDRDEALQKGYFPPVNGILFNGWSAPLDLTNSAAVALWKDRLGRYVQMGVEGFKLDYGEDVVPAIGAARNVWQFHDGTDERVGHYQYQLAYHGLYASLVPQSGGFLLCRAGRYGDQKNVSVVWPGDMDATFTRFREVFMDGNTPVVGVGGLPATVIQGMGLGASGFPFFASDTGGYRHSPPDKELYIRWFEQTALSTVMEVGDQSSQPPWEFTGDNGRDIETLDLYRQYARLHMRLFPYEWTYAQNLKKDGRPIQRPVGLAYPQLGQHPSDEYLFGDDLLVAPVVDRGVQQRAVLFPPGDWLDYWDGTVYSGGTAGATGMVAAPLGKLPLFLRAGAIVPLLRPTIDTISPATDPGVESFANDAGALYFRLVPGPQPATRTLYDGATLSLSAQGAPLQVQVKPGSVFVAATNLEVLRTSQPSQVLRDGMPLPQLAAAPDLDMASEGWFWQGTAGGTLLIKLAARPATQVVTAH